MKNFAVITFVSMMCLSVATLAYSQHNHGHVHQQPQHIHNQHPSNYTYTQPGYHIDHHNHPIVDNHGHVVGNSHHDVVHSNSSYVVPHVDAHHPGTYYYQNGGYYYSPTTHIPTTSPSTTITTHHAPTPIQVKFGSFSHVDELADRLETVTNDFCLDLHHNYQHNAGYAETYAEAYQILEVAKFIHSAEHNHDRQAIASKLNGLDKLFHHVEDDVRLWSRHHHQQVGALGIIAKMDLMESTIHHLMNDVGVSPTPANSQVAPPPGGNLQIAPPPALKIAPVPGSTLTSPPPGI